MNNSNRTSSLCWEDYNDWQDEWQEFYDCFGDCDFATQIIRMKRNDPEVDCLKLWNVGVYGGDDDGWDHVWTRLENIIGENEYVDAVKLCYCVFLTWTWFGRALGRNVSITQLTIGTCDVDWVALSYGLQSNQSIQKLFLEDIEL